MYGIALTSSSFPQWKNRRGLRRKPNSSRAFASCHPSPVVPGHHRRGAGLQRRVVFRFACGLLFHRAVLMSGSALSPWALVEAPARYAHAVARHANCSPELPRQALLRCLRDRPLDAGSLAASFLLRKAAVAKLTRYDLLQGVVKAEAYFAFNGEDVQYGIEADRRYCTYVVTRAKEYLALQKQTFKTVRDVQNVEDNDL
ncbi:Uncharacterized protein GBIM_00341 [Gryllus bimaculatus]|nr:Uncharacterized protein GBIM_00341 [Gryllus bimaculatus]